MKDRRKHQRYKLDEACIINHNKTVGTIIDISLGGLSCGCLYKNNCREDCLTGVNIYCKMFNIQAENITMKVLGSEVIPGKFSEDIRFKICRGEFHRLDEAQELQLTNLITRTSLSV